MDAIRTYRTRRSPASLGRRRGTALVATVVLVAMILALTTVGLLVARSDVLLFRNLRDGTATYYRAHAAIARSVAELTAGYAFDSLLVGPDGAPGTADDGTPPAPTAVPGCRVQAVDDSDDSHPSPCIDGNQRVRLITQCSGPRNARRDVEAIVGRSAAPFIPAALYLERIDLDVFAPVSLDGADHARGDLAGVASGPGDPVPAAASPALEAPMVLPSGVRSGNGERIVALPAAQVETPAFSTQLLMMVPPFLTSLPEGEFGLAFIHTAGDERVTAPATGAGLLVVDEQLEIDAPVDFSGVVVVGGSLRVGATGALSVSGLLWVRGDGSGPAISAAGPLSVVYSSEAVTEVDRTLRLPRRAVLLAEREVF